MDLINIQALIRDRKLIKPSDIDPTKSYVQVGVFQTGTNSSNPNAYAPYVISLQDLADLQAACGSETPLFKEGSIGPKVSFVRPDYTNIKDVIVPGKLEIARDSNGGGIYNAAMEGNYNYNSPADTSWNTQYIDPANTNWAPLWDIKNRSYDTWRKGARTPEGHYAPPQYVGMPAIMYSTSQNRYWLIMFKAWTHGGNGGGFAYDRWEILSPVTFTKPDYETQVVDRISDGVRLARQNYGPLYNAISETYSEVGVSPQNTKWNSVYTDSRPGYSGFSDLSNLENRVYTDFALALDYQVGNNVLNTELIMHDLTTDLYWKFTFTSWTRNGNGGGFEYIREVVPQSCPIKFADGSIMTTAPTAGSASSCPYCPYNDGQDNLVIADNSDILVNVAPGSTHLIDNFSGMLIVNDHYDGRVETWIAGGGDGILLGYTNVGAGPCTSTLTIISNGYEWHNNDNMVGPFTFTVIKTRSGA